MKLPSDVVIAQEKLREYLLAWRARNDKSKFLAQAGYDAANWQVLEADLRKLAGSAEADLEQQSAFGDLLLARGNLRGPSGVILKVKTIWIRLAGSDQIRFVTLFPDKE